MYFIKIDKNKNGDIQADIIKQLNSNPTIHDKLKLYYESIGCELIDIVSLTNNVDVIVDDEGLLKSGNLILQVGVDEIDEYVQLAAPILIGANQLTDDGIETVGFKSSKEALSFLYEASVSVIGTTDEVTFGKNYC